MDNTSVTSQSLRVLLVEDSEDDTELTLMALRHGGLNFVARRVETEPDYIAALNPAPDLILTDYYMPHFTAERALELLQAHGLDIPFIVVSGLVDAEAAVALMRAGAHDFLLKDDLTRLCPAIQRELHEARGRAERRLAEQQLRDSQERQALAVRGARLGTWDWHIYSGQLIFNARWAGMLGYTIGEIEPHVRARERLIHPEDAPRMKELLNAHLEGRTEFYEAEYRLRAKDGSWVWVLDSARVFERDSQGKPVRAAGTHLDISDRKAAEAQVQYLAHHDELTGLPNRALLMNFMGPTMAYADRDGHCLAVLFIDLDHFKTINDSLGHQAGDRLLKQVAARLKRCERKSDILARLSGDEFVMVLSGVRDVQGVACVAEKIVTSLARPYRAGDRVLSTSCSIGISIYPTDAREVHTLMKNADMAMYHTKERGRNHYQFFSREMGARADERLKLSNTLRQALEHEEFVLHYQPYFDLASGRLTGMEALMRWNHPELGLLTPVRFIPLAEETGMIAPIGHWVMRTACRQAKAWRDAGLDCPRMAVNLSARQFRQLGLSQQIASILKDAGLDASALELEITESMAMQDPERTKELLWELEAIGIGLSIDDFGTGYSSLSYLKGLPIRCLKIDCSFIDGVPDDPNDSAITRATIALAKILGVVVIAEGIETEAQHSFLTIAGCENGQGYLLGKPAPAAEVAAQLQPLHAAAEKNASAG
jgi:diguanylate cyclase (GGDEF)-like protein/PAS domain S-box-containing protein